MTTEQLQQTAALCKEAAGHEHARQYIDPVVLAALAAGTALVSEVERLRAGIAALDIPHDSACPRYEGSAAELARIACYCDAEPLRAEIAALLNGETDG